MNNSRDIVTGTTGATDATILQGLSELAYIYNLLLQTVSVETNISFSSNGVISAAIIHAMGTNSITNKLTKTKY